MQHSKGSFTELSTVLSERQHSLTCLEDIYSQESKHTEPRCTSSRLELTYRRVK